MVLYVYQIPAKFGTCAESSLVFDVNYGQTGRFKITIF